jgi:hypothetical protein
LGARRGERLREAGFGSKWPIEPTQDHAEGERRRLGEAWQAEAAGRLNGHMFSVA